MQGILVGSQYDNVVTIPEIILHPKVAFDVVVQQTEVKVTEQLAGMVADCKSGPITMDNAYQGLHHRLVLDFAAEPFYQDVLVDRVIEFLEVKFQAVAGIRTVF